jgi:BASS family bile acid:Na+ symporter
MFSLGIGLTGADFLRILQRPLAFCVGAFNQVILLPLVVFGCIWAFGVSGVMAVGLMILAACPGGVTSNVIAKWARGDVALSVSLTAVISLASVITVPTILAFALNRFLDSDAPQVDITQTAVTMFLLTVVPILLGLSLRRFAPSLTQRIEPVVSVIATVLFALIIVAAIAANWSLFVTNVQVLGPVLLTLLVLLTLVGFVVPRLLGRTQREAKTISIETGVQNGTLGIAVATLLVSDGAGISPYALPSAIYGVFMYLIIVPVLLIYRRMD